MGTGLYAAMKDPKVIIGQTTSLGLAGRLGERYYSSAERVVDHLGG